MPFLAVDNNLNARPYADIQLDQDVSDRWAYGPAIESAAHDSGRTVEEHAKDLLFRAQSLHVYEKSGRSHDLRWLPGNRFSDGTPGPVDGQKR